MRSYARLSLSLAAVPLVILCTPFANAQSWSLSGNALGGNPSFLGTTDNNPLVIETNASEAMRVDASGKIGVGTNNPQSKLDIVSGGNFDSPQVSIQQTVVSEFARLRFNSFALDTGGTPIPLLPWDIAVGQGAMNFFVAGGAGNIISLNKNGNVGVGTTRPLNKLHVVGDGITVEAPCTEQGCIFSGVSLSSDGVLFASGNGDSLTLKGTEGVFVDSDLQVNARATMNQDLRVNARATVNVLQITGGSDLAEPFEIAGPVPPKPGIVLAIDPDHPGQLRVAAKAYDRTVSGVVSGANGIHAGVTMKQEGMAGTGSVAVSLSGRVYCWADSSYGPIEAGDLLTTSNTPGYAMKVSDFTRANGAIIGKAMTSLPKGQGLVLMLVSLQ